MVGERGKLVLLDVPVHGLLDIEALAHFIRLVTYVRLVTYAIKTVTVVKFTRSLLNPFAGQGVLHFFRLLLSGAVPAAFALALLAA